MKTKRMFSLIGVAALGLTASLASAATHALPMMTRPAMTRPAPRFAPRTMTGTHRFFNGRDNRFRRFHNRTFIFVDSFGFPFFYPYPYYGYYPYAYYGYDHGAIDGIMGPRTRRAIRAYEHDHNMPAYGVIDRQVLTTMGLG